MGSGVRNVQQLRRNSGAHAVYTALRDRIVSLDVEPGVRLFEDAVSREFGVSRTPVREAFRLLVAEGLLQQQATGAMTVAPLDPDEMSDVYTLRATLEGLLARNAAERATSAERAEIRELGQRMTLLSEHEDEVRRLGRDFHELIARCARNRYAETMLHQLRSQLDRYRALGDQRAYRRPQILDEHLAIGNAILAGDPDEADTAVRKHALAGYEAARSAVAPNATPDDAPTEPEERAQNG